ncbi:MAG: HAD family phosphatase [Marinilabiliaceae bacterium]|nr:HAD family phosphatase [Marinilabiliaceae bacterium]
MTLDFKAYFFDMDGVLYDSMPNHEYTWTNSFASFGILFPSEMAYINEGRTGRGTINLVMNKLYGRDASEQEITDIYGLKTKLMQGCPKAPVMPSMQDIISYLREKGKQVFVVTGSKQPSLIDKLNADFAFDAAHVVSGADVKMGKPDPEPYLIALQRSGLSRDECAVIENAPLGVRAAKAAGLFCIGVNTGKLDDHYLTDEGVDVLFHSTAELKDILV